MSSIRTLTLVSLLAACLASPASAYELHVGASIGRSDYRIDSTGAASADTRDTGGKFFVGTTLTPNLGVEATWYDLGRASGSVVVPGVGTIAASARARGIGLAGVASVPLGPVSMFAKAGLVNVRTRLETNVATGLPGSETSWQPAMGLGVSYAFDRQLALRGEWERVRARFPGGEKENVDLLSVGLTYRF